MAELGRPIGVGEQSTCRIRPAGERFGDLDAQFKLIGDTAPPGEIAFVPLVIHADRACEGIGFDVAYDREVLEALSIEKLYPPATDVPYRSEKLWFAEDGHLRGYVIFEPDEPSTLLPAHQDHEIVGFEFLVNPETTVQSTEILFHTPADRASSNIFRAFEDTYTPELADSFVLISGFINGDGDDDLVVLPVADHVRIYTSDGAGGFELDSRSIEGSLGNLPHAVTIADLGSGGDVELVTANYDETDERNEITILELEEVPRSGDENSNGVPDECEVDCTDPTSPGFAALCDPLFHRGDVNDDGSLNIVDPIALLGHLFSGDAAPPCAEAADANDDGRLDLTDAILVLNFLFGGGGNSLAEPGPPPAPCGADPAATAPLGCETYSSCD